MPLPLIFGLAASSALFIVLGGGMALRARRRPVLGGHEEMVGTLGEVLQAQAGESWAQVRGERWQVASAMPLQPGQRVRVVGQRGLTLDVVPLDSDGGAPISSTTRKEP